jgi:transposase
LKLRPPHIKQRFIFECTTVLSELREELAGQSKVLYVDETVFSKKAL